MNRLILIGNGFDLAHGLKTSYHDFILDYLKVCIEKACYSNRHYIDDRDYYEMWFDDKLLIKISSRSKPNRSIHQGKTITFLDKIKTLDSVSEIINISIEHNVTISANKSNSFSSNLLNECITKKWVDIESMYYEELKKSLRQYNKEKDHNGKASTGNLEHLNNQLDYVKIKLEEHLIEVQSKKNDEIIGIKNIFYNNLKKKHINDDDRIRRIDKVLILNFNYTNTPSKYLDNDYYSEIINIHGELNNNNNAIVFGYGDDVDKYYNDIEELNENKFFMHIKSFDYFKTSNYKKLLAFINTMGPMVTYEPFEVYIMGHSCGLSDRTMLSTIFENEKCEKIKIFYYQEDNKNDYRDKTYEISRHFRDKPSMRNKIISIDESIPMPQAP